eukprot:CAMPEP_0118950716 /NCGR_PEP_ID=MMETSP1169-20130426/51891_1 /TAXON_ID=36882 /ORGANISM="Pyramimonas obovata, Strain CCMP722" /LENGTH=37 /DNA_ID= /DNA_START= /DNA_END= /DNA_ORIENTATION=
MSGLNTMSQLSDGLPARPTRTSTYETSSSSRTTTSRR